ncbi:MAG: noncanonical pyrimidine nucleotidase, YjjG family [Bacteroidetes bacterium]|nr:MAG: noncanonical pyrimidine nucleotidase, YjjG family [Bacteroidota bacterium]
MKYQHLFFDLDHTLWDFETNSKQTWQQLYHAHQLQQTLTPDFEAFYARYSYHNKRLWDRYHHGFIKQEELRWKRTWHTFLDFKLGNEALAKVLSAEYLTILPTQSALFPYTHQIIDYLTQKGYQLHLITNGFEDVQWGKLRTCNLHTRFKQVITSERAMSLKPKSQIFEFALQAAGASLHQSIMLGDNIDADIKGAMGVGMDTVFVNHIGETIDIKPTYEVYDLKALEDIF